MNGPFRPQSNRVGWIQFCEQLFERFPLGFPVALLFVGPTQWIVIRLVAISGGPMSAYSLAIAVVCSAAGIVILPFGVRTAIRRRKPVHLVCPTCGTVSHLSPQPFSVQRWDDVPYAYVVCSACGKDFTVDKWTKLR